MNELYLLGKKEFSGGSFVVGASAHFLFLIFFKNYAIIFIENKKERKEKVIMTYNLYIPKNQLIVLDNYGKTLCKISLKDTDYYLDERGDWYFTEDGADVVSTVLRTIMPIKKKISNKGSKSKSYITFKNNEYLFKKEYCSEEELPF